MIDDELRNTSLGSLEDFQEKKMGNCLENRKHENEEYDDIFDIDSIEWDMELTTNDAITDDDDETTEPVMHHLNIPNDEPGEVTSVDNSHPRSIMSKPCNPSIRSSRQASVSIDPATFVNYPKDQRPSFRLPQRMTSRRSTIFPTPSLCCMNLFKTEDSEEKSPPPSPSPPQPTATTARTTTPPPPPFKQSWISRLCYPVRWCEEDKAADLQISDDYIEKVRMSD